MADIPPSYTAATARDVWAVITAQVNLTASFHTLCIVNRDWNKKFTKHLWGRPWFQCNHDVGDIYFSFTTFLKCLRFTRPAVLQWTHTLETPRALRHSDFQLADTWLRDIFSILPNLKCVLLPGLRIFDARSLSKLDPRSSFSNSSSHSIRVLNVSGCSNISSKQFSAALIQFKNLVYLDVSYVPTIDRQTLVSIADFDILPRLQILKARGINLTDASLIELVSLTGTRLYCLDVRNNALTDKCIPSILDYCFLPPEYHDDGPNRSRHMVETFKEDAEEWHVVECISKWGTIWPANEPAPGLSQLFISGNRLGVESLNGLLLSQRLEILDFGQVAKTKGEINLFKDDGAKQEALLQSIVQSKQDSAYNLLQKLKWLRIDPSLVIVAASGNTDLLLDPDGQDTGQEGLAALARNVQHLGALYFAPVPAKVPEEDLVDGLKGFIKALANVQKQPLNDNNPFTKMVKQRPEMQGILEVVFEMQSVQEEPSRARKDVVADDVSRLTAELQKDFSFFEDEKESNSAILNPAKTSLRDGIDVVKELSRYRRECKARNKDIWRGTIKIAKYQAVDIDGTGRSQWGPSIYTRWG